MVKPRKPRDIKVKSDVGFYIQVYRGGGASIKGDVDSFRDIYANDARKLAAWLLKAADWLEARERDEG